MEIYTENHRNIQLNEENGVLTLANLSKETHVHLYDSKGKLLWQSVDVEQEACFTLPERGLYLLVMGHPVLRTQVIQFTYK